MQKTIQSIGFSYFSTPEYLIRKRVETWFPIMSQLGGTQVVLKADFSRAIPEDVFQTARENGLEPIIHFISELPLARKFNELSIILDSYARWGVKFVILGDKPNTKSAWQGTGWQYDNLVDHFLDRFIPIANYIEQIGMTPVLPPLQPGGDYWDTAFIEKVLEGLKRRQMTELLENICLSGYGYSFGRNLSWGAGGPEQWPSSKPYLTPEGQEDQIGFQNFEWIQAIALRVTGRKIPAFILDAGNDGTGTVPMSDSIIEKIQLVLKACRGDLDDTTIASNEYPRLNENLLGCAFSLDTLLKVFNGELSIPVLGSIFKPGSKGFVKSGNSAYGQKTITHYLLLPWHDSGVSDVVLNKVRPVIKQLRPTIGFSLEEATRAKKVTVFPDPQLFTDNVLNGLRSAGCSVEVLPQSGIEIATHLQSTAFRN